MAGFNFEKNLPHQEQAIKSTVAVFDGVEIIKSEGIQREFANSFFNKGINRRYHKNIWKRFDNRTNIYKKSV